MWSDIGKRLESPLDVLCFRSVCRTWRRSLPPPLRFPLKVPRLPSSTVFCEAYPYFISEVTFYSSNRNQIFLFEKGDQFSVFDPSRGNQFSASSFAPFAPYNRMMSHKIQIPPISTLSYLSTAYHIHFRRPLNYDPNCVIIALVDPCVCKIAIICSDYALPNPNYPQLTHLKLVAHLSDKKLAVLSLSGTNNWETGFCDIIFEDIVNYRGRLYCVDNTGRAFFMDYHSLQMTQVAPAIPKLYGVIVVGERKRMHLAVVSEELYMFISNLVTPRLYKLKLGKWVEADQDLPNQVFIQTLQCNFVAPRKLFVPCRDDSVITYELPRICSWPKYIFCRVFAMGKEYSSDRLPFNYCDLHASLDPHP